MRRGQWRARRAVSGDDGCASIDKLHRLRNGAVHRFDGDSDVPIARCGPVSDDDGCVSFDKLHRLCDRAVCRCDGDGDVLVVRCGPVPDDSGRVSIDKLHRLRNGYL